MTVNEMAQRGKDGTNYFAFDDHSTLAWVCLKDGWGWSLMQLRRGPSKARDAWDAMDDNTKINGPKAPASSSS